jgi:hypothetical protein
MEPKVKFVKFVFNDQEFKYKFPENDPWEITEQTIRKKFKLLSSDQFLLMDMADNYFISHTMLPLLDDNSSVRVEILQQCNLSATLLPKM